MKTLAEAIQDHIGFDVHKIVDDETGDILFELGSDDNPTEEQKQQMLVDVVAEDHKSKTLFVHQGFWFVPSDWRHGR